MNDGNIHNKHDNADTSKNTKNLDNTEKDFQLPLYHNKRKRSKLPRLLGFCGRRDLWVRVCGCQKTGKGRSAEGFEAQGTLLPWRVPINAMMGFIPGFRD